MFGGSGLGLHSPLTALFLRNPEMAAAYRRQQYAEALGQGAMSGEPIRSPWQGVNKLAQAGIAAMLMGRSDDEMTAAAAKQREQEAAQEAQGTEFMNRALGLINPQGGGSPMSQALLNPNGAPPQQPPQAQPQPQPQEPGQPTQIPDALLPHFQRASAETGVPIPVLAAVARQESGFRPNAVGDDGKSTGTMQVQARTARDPGFGVAPIDPAKLNDPGENIMFGARYLAGRAKAAGVTDWYDPAQRALALKAYNGGGDPNYVNHVERFIPGTGGQPAGDAGADPSMPTPPIPPGTPQGPGAPQAAVAPQPAGPQGAPTQAQYAALEVEIQKGRQLQALAVAGGSSTNPTIKKNAENMRVIGTQMENRAIAERNRLDTLANREMKTIDLQDPTDGKAYTYENTPNGPGRKIGLAKDQPTGKQDDLAVINRLGPKVAQGTASQQEVIDYNGAATQYQTARVIQTDKGTFSIKPLLPPGMPEPQTPPWLQQPQGQVTPQGGPAPQGQPAPQASNLPPGVTEFKNTERDPPQAIVGAMLENGDNIRRIDDALKGVAGNPDAVGPWNYVARGPVANWWQPGGAEARAMVADIGSLKIHDRSGAAVTASESPRLAPFIPLVTDPAPIVKTKLEKFAKEYRNILMDQYQVYGPASNYRALAPVESILKSQPPSGMVSSPGASGPNLDDLIAERERRKAAR